MGTTPVTRPTLPIDDSDEDGALSVVATPERILDTLLLARRALQSDTVVLLRLNETNGRLRVVAGEPAEEVLPGAREAPSTAGLPGVALREGRAAGAIVGDHADRLLPYLPTNRLVENALAVPVSARRFRGVLVVERIGTVPFGREEARTAESAARAVGWLLEAGEAFEEEARRAAGLETIEEAAQRLAASDTPRNVGATLDEALRGLVPADVVIVTAVNREEALEGEHEETRFHPIFTRGVSFAGDATHGPTRGLVGRAIQRRQTLPTGARFRPESGDVFADALRWTPRRPGALVAVPLSDGGDARGCLVVHSTDVLRYDAERVMLLGTLGNLAGAALGRQHREAALAALARTDPLTRLVNRRAFDESLTLALLRSTRYHYPTSLLMLDVDHFKRVNDTYGHPVGDVVLRTLGGMLRQIARGVDVPARVGGEEFALLLEHTAPAGAAIVAERVRQAFANTPFPVDSGELRVTISIGVATYPDAPNAAELWSQADAALYRAKREGRDRVVLAQARQTD